jgi:Phosphatidate cytidylyltransferase, mitochondrial
MNSGLDETILTELAARAPDSVVALGESLRQRFGAHALAVLFYGSIRRSHDDEGGIVDLYVLVDRYRDAYANALPALANRVLAPNVYYLETPFAGRAARAKYAVVSLDHFERGTARWFHPYLWGRFAQPCGVLYAADNTVRQRVVGALGTAVAHFARRTLPRLPAEFDAEALWTRGLMLTYAAELRSERPEKIAALYGEASAELKARTRALAAKNGWELAAAGRYRNPSTALDRWRSACGWAVCRVQGKLLSVLRLLKASLTFDGGLPYIVWKIERHSGVNVAITPFMRRFPRLGAIGALWRTWRLGGFR